MQLLSIGSFNLSVNGRALFSVKQLNINKCEKICLVGANGSGKTTFLDTIISGGGTKHIGANGHFIKQGLWAYFKQKSAELPRVSNFEQISRWELQNISKREDADFSGGEEVRLRLAEAFSTPHDIIVLDEPAAHLDKDGLEELERQLKGEDTFILVSHDRNLLNKFCTRTLVIMQGELIDFPGTYDEWKEQNELDFKSRLNEYEKKKHEKARLEKAADEQKRRAARTQRKPRSISYSEAKGRVYGAVGKSIGNKFKSLNSAAKNTQKRMERLGKIEKPKIEPNIRPDFSVTDPPQNKIIVEIKDLNFSYPNCEKLFNNLNFSLKRNIRTAIIGANGAGKSTLLKLILNGYEGIRAVPKAKFGFFEQSFGNINFNKTVLENIHEASVQKESINRNALARMGFKGRALEKKAGVLSGGELTRLSFAKLFVSDCNALLIDEPGNYLDITSYEAIEKLLLDFEGTMLFCSHDERFLKTIAEEVWELKAGKLHQKTLNENKTC